MFAPVVEGKCQFEKQCSGFCVCFFSPADRFCSERAPQYVCRAAFSTSLHWVVLSLPSFSSS